MAVLKVDDNGWVISHELFIENTYRKTNCLGKVKSYHLNPVLFEIKIPFRKRKVSSENCGKEAEEIVVCKRAHKNLLSSYKALNVSSDSGPPENNSLAKSLADRFYSQLTRHPESNFKGGNFSQEPLLCKIGEESYVIPQKCLFYCYDIKQVPEHLGDQEFDFILMDPPWWNKFIRRKRKKNSKFGYGMVYDKDLADIPISSLLSQNGLVAVWCTSAPSHINSVLTDLFPAWDIQFIAQWFWLKVTKLGKPICDFSPNSKKQPFERIIFGIKRNSVRSFPSPKTDKVIMSVPSAIHSHKPPLCELLKSYLPKEPKCLELFARYLLPEWTSYGNEVLKLQHLSLYVEGNAPENS